MEKEISELKELEDEIANMIYEKVDQYWGKFPNLWKYVTKDDMVSATALDLYRPSKYDGVPNILHYYRTKGERSLKPLVGLVTYNVLMHEARFIHSTGLYDKPGRKEVFSPISTETVICDSDSDNVITLGDTIASDANIEEEIEYESLFDSLPNKKIENVYFMDEDERFHTVSYKYLLKQLLDGYNLTQISDKLYKQKSNGSFCKFKDLSNVVKSMKEEIKQFLSNEYGYTEEQYEKGWTL